MMKMISIHLHKVEQNNLTNSMGLQEVDNKLDVHNNDIDKIILFIDYLYKILREYKFC